MNKATNIILLVSIFIVLSIIALPGLLKTVPDPVKYPTYPLYSKITEVSTVLPKTVELPTNVSLRVTYPDGNSKGLFTIGTYDRNVDFTLPEHSLYQTGIYTAKYETGNTIHNEFFFVGTVDSRLVFTPNITTYNGQTTVKVTNNGKINGFAYITIINNEFSLEDTKMLYNEILYSEIIYIRNGFYEEITVQSENIILLVNDEIYQ